MTLIRLMTMNLGSGSGEPYVDFTVAAHVRFINSVEPDVAFLQEVDRSTGRAGGVDQLAVLRDSTPLVHSHFVKSRNLERGEYGVGIISRFPLQDLENRSVYQWPWFSWWFNRVVAPVAYASVQLAEGRLRLYATHFSSRSDQERKLSAETIARGIPDDGLAILGGDFNDGPGGMAMTAIDAKLVPAEAIATNRVITDRGATCSGTDAAIDHFYLSRSLTCDSFTSVAGVEGSRGCFSDHPIVWADLRLPPPPEPAGRLETTLEPYPASLNHMIDVVVHARDAATHAPVDGMVLIDGSIVARTDVLFSMLLQPKFGQEFDPDLKRWLPTVTSPVVIVRASGYPDGTVDLGVEL